MQNQFEKFIQKLLADHYDILPDVDKNFNFESDSEEEVLRSLNIVFLVMLSGK